jgi:hypothetical protein
MAITSTFADPPPDDHVPLPWHPTGRSATQLRRRSAAVITWLAEVHARDVLRLHGDVPTALMTRILQRLAPPSA